MTERAQRRLHVVQEVRHGLERGEFTPYFQRQVDLRSGATIGFESLARWQHPTRGLLAPGEFIPVAEEMGLMSALDQTILFQCCLQGRKWLDAGQSFGRVAVNLSAVDLQQDTFHREILQILEQTGLPSRCLELELTESAFMELRAATLTGLRQLRESGVKLTIDDFGTGYSSLLYLKRLPVDRLKIDKGFIWDMEGSPETRSIVQTIIELARVLGLETVAEGVETEAQRAQLQALGCTIGQGFLWGRPAPEPELELKPEPSPT
nr:EAL domain-containing protein [Halorhodospira abdelmalekii]